MINWIKVQISDILHTTRRVIKLQLHTCDMLTHIFLRGHLDFPSSTTQTHPHTWTHSSSADFLWRSQTHVAWTARAAETEPVNRWDLSGVRPLQLDSLWHPPGAVQRHSHPHRGHRHGDRIDEAALRLNLDLTRHLPLWTRWTHRWRKAVKIFLLLTECFPFSHLGAAIVRH